MRLNSPFFPIFLLLVIPAIFFPRNKWYRLFLLFPVLCIAAASLDNHLYIMDARNGDIVMSYFTGRPIWDKVAKGDTLWGSPVAIEAEEETALIHGSFNDVVYMLPVAKECSLRAMARSTGILWWSLLFVLIIFGGIVLPVIINLPLKQNSFNPMTHEIF